MTVERPLVSLIISNYNYGRYLREAIDSALAQTYPAIEVIVVDDGSTDNSREVIAAYGDRVVAVFKENEGLISAINAGYSRSRGDIVCFMDSDDVMLPHRVERAVAMLDAHPQVGWVRSKVRHVDENLQPIGLEGPRGSTHLVPPNPYLYLERHPAVSNSYPATRRTVASEIFPMPMPPTKGNADAVFNVLLGTVDKPVHGYFLDEVLYLYRRHQAQQYSSYNDTVGALKEALEVGRLTSSIWSQRTGVKRAGTHVYTHSLIVSIMEGQPLWGLRRWSDFVKGLGEGAALFPRSPRLALRQTMRVSAAFLTPRIWLKRWRPGGGYTPNTTAS
jgi:glycosyltransferase involved in cell wall biosynthesis